MAGQLGFQLPDAFVGDIQPAEAVEQRLQEAARAGGEIRVGAARRFGQHAKGRHLVGQIRFGKQAVSLVGVAEAGVQQAQVGKAHGRPVGIHLGFVIVHVLAYLRRVGGLFQRVGQQRHIGLLDGLAVVGGVFAGHAVVQFQNHQSGGHFGPFRVGGDAHFAGGLGGIAQHLAGHAIGKGVVVHVFGIFVGTHHIDDVVLAIAAAFGAAGPEIGHFLQHRPAAFSQPGLVFGHLVVFPERPAHVARDVVLERPGQSPDRRGFLPFVVRFPREHRPFVAVAERIVFGRFQPLETVFEQRFRDFGVQQQQRRVHPQFGVPEHVSVVAQARQAHRRQAVSGAFAGKRIEVVQRKMHVALHVGIAVQHNVALPEFVPGFGVAFFQAGGAFKRGKNREPFGLVVRVGHVFGGSGGADHGEAVSLSGFHVDGEFEAVRAVIPFLVDQGGFLAARLIEDEAVGCGHRVLARRTFRHRGQQRDQRMRTVYQVVEILHVAQHIRGRKHAVRRDGNVFLGGDFHFQQGRMRQMAQGHHGLLHRNLVGVVKRGRQRGGLHIEGLGIIKDTVFPEPDAVHFQVHVGKIEGFHDVRHASPPVSVKRAVEHHVLDLQRFRRRYNTDHAVGHGHAVVVVGVYFGGLHVPHGVGDILRRHKCGLHEKEHKTGKEQVCFLNHGKKQLNDFGYSKIGRING